MNLNLRVLVLFGGGLFVGLGLGLLNMGFITLGTVLVFLFLMTQ